MSLIKREKKNLTYNKTFWKTVKPLFTDKVQTKSKITLAGKKVASREDQEQTVSEKVISEDQVVAEVFNKVFINTVPNFKISPNHNDFIVTNNQVTNALNKFRNYPSIVVIKSKRKIDQCFSFGPVT